MIAWRGEPLRGVELLIGAGTDHPRTEWKPLDLTGQVFVPVQPHDWLATNTPTDPGPEPPDLSAAVAELRAQLDEVRAAVDAQAHRLEVPESRPLPVCGPQSVSTGRAWGHAHTLTVTLCQ